MKKTYQMPEMQVLLHSEEDVVRTSFGNELPDLDNPF